MLDFQKLEVYQKARKMHEKVLLFLKENKKVPLKLNDQVSRAALSVMLNIAEGSGRFTKPDKKHYYAQARGSAFESLACLEACFDLGHLDDGDLRIFQNEYEDISKMLFAMIRKLEV